MHDVCYRYVAVGLSICQFRDILVIFNFGHMNEFVINIHHVDTFVFLLGIFLRSEMARFYGVCQLLKKLSNSFLKWL